MTKYWENEPAERQYYCYPKATGEWYYKKTWPLQKVTDEWDRFCLNPCKFNFFGICFKRFYKKECTDYPSNFSKKFLSYHLLNLRNVIRIFFPEIYWRKHLHTDRSTDLLLIDNLFHSFFEKRCWSTVYLRSINNWINLKSV